MIAWHGRPGWRRVTGTASAAVMTGLVGLGALQSLRSHGHLPGVMTGYNGVLHEVTQDGDKARIAHEAQRAVDLLINERHVLHYNLALALRDQGRRDEAMAALRRALGKRPAYSAARRELGRLLLEGKAYGEAIVALGQVAGEMPGDADAVVEHANALYLAGRVPEAAVRFRSAIALRPDHVRARYNLGLALRAVGDVDAAILEFRRVLALQPGHARAAAKLGQVEAERAGTMR